MQSISYLAVAFFAIFAFTNRRAFAATNADWSNLGVKATSNIKTGGIFTDLNTIVGIIIALGGVWVILCLIFAGMKLAAGSNGNPQARTQGLVGLACAAGGGIVIMKCFTIAGWIAGFGG